MSGFVSCNTLNAALAEKQDSLKGCNGAPLVGPVPSCAQMDAAIAASAPPNATSALRGVVELATVAETVSGLDSERAVTPEGVKAAVDAGIAAALADMQDVFAL